MRRAGIGPVVADVRVEGGRLTEVGRALRRVPGEAELDAAGGAVLPGLHDHHLHVLSLMAASRSVRVGPPDVRDPAGFAAALNQAASDGPDGEWIRAVAYHQSVAGDLDRDVLDRVLADRPVRVQHRSGMLWVCNSAGLAALGADREPAPGIERDEAGRPTGRLWRMDGWVAEHLQQGGAGDAGDRVNPGDLSGLGGLSAAAAARGVTGWTDATPGRSDRDTRFLLDGVASGAVRQRLCLMLPTDPDTIGPEQMADAGVSPGPVKILLDDASLPGLDHLTETVSAAHRRGSPVAVHCVTRVQLMLTLAALEEAGAAAGDRIEHGALIPGEVLLRLAALGLTVVTQPNFVAERGDEYLSEVPLSDQPDLWRARSLVAAGVAVAAGTDAPFGSPDPWLAVRAATRRRAPSGRRVSAAEAVATPTALRWWEGTASAPASPRRLAPGAPADLVVLAAPLAEALYGDDAVPVVATIVAGEVVFSAEKR